MMFLGHREARVLLGPLISFNEQSEESFESIDMCWRLDSNGWWDGKVELFFDEDLKDELNGDDDSSSSWCVIELEEECEWVDVWWDGGLEVKLDDFFDLSLKIVEVKVNLEFFRCLNFDS